MTTWRKTVALKDLLGDDDSVEATRKAAAGMVARLCRLPEYEAQWDLESIVDEFRDIADLDPDTLYDPLCEYFNEVLAALYDWADGERIWIGGKPS